MLVSSGTKWVSDRSTATKIVAASNSSQAIKDAADYVADGTDDQVEINAALTAAAGGKVFIAEGTYFASATITVPNNTTLAGAGTGTSIEFANLAGASDNLIENSDTSTGTGVTIQDLSLNGRDDLNTAGTVHGIYLSGMGDGSGTGVGARQGGKVHGVYAHDFLNRAIYLSNSDNNTISSNTTEDNGSTGIYLSSSTNNTIATNHSQGNAYGVYLITSSSHNTISGNTVEGNTVEGIAIESSSNNNTVAGNTIKGNVDEGIYLESVSGNAITGNMVSGSTGSGGIYLWTASNNTIVGNSIYDNDMMGIMLRADSNNNVVSANKIYDNGGATTNDGIYLDASDSNAITGNDITDTSCSTNCYAINISNSTSDSNYLADNRHNGPSAAYPSTINDADTGTIYANQISPSQVLQSSSSYIRANATSVITGSIDPTASASVTGVGTYFLSQLQIGDRITVNAETRTIIAIASDTALTVDTAFTNTANDASVDRLPSALLVQNSSGVNTLTVSDSGSVAIAGAYTGNSPKFSLGGTIVDSDTASNYGFHNQVYFQKATNVTHLYGLNNIPVIQTGAGNVSNAYGALSRVETRSGYTGKITNGYSFYADQPYFQDDVANQRIDQYSSFYAQMPTAIFQSMRGNSGNTSGVIYNNGLKVASGSAQAGSGGILNNYSLNVELSSGNTAGTNNYGLYLTGNGGASATSNYAIYSTSTAASLLSGNLDIQSGSTGNLLRVRDTTATARDVLVVADGGAVTLQNQTNSAAAFAVKNDTGTTFLNVDTTNKRTEISNGYLRFAGNTTSNVALSIDQGSFSIQSSLGTSQYGIQNQPNFNFDSLTGDLANLYSLVNIAQIGTNANSRKITTAAYGEYVRIDNPTATTIENVYGLYVANNNALDVTSIKNKYGIYIQKAEGASTIETSLYVAGDNNNHFAVWGNGIVRSRSTNALGFQILQGSTGSTLFSADTSGMKLTIGGSLVASGASTATTGTTEATARTNVTTVTLTAAGSFANNDVIFINNAGQDYYTRIVSGGGTTTLTVSPAVSYDVSASVTKYNIQNIGATTTDYTTQSNRFFQGYFTGGVVTGAGSTTLSDGNLYSTGNLILQRSSGSVGVGTSSPASLLDVAGQITSSGASGGSIAAYNPNNQSANVSLNWLSDTARIRVGGTGVGSANGFKIQGVSDTDLFTVNGSGDAVVSGKLTVNGDTEFNGSNFADGMNIQNGSDLKLRASTGSVNDSGDIIFLSNNDTERLRVWSDASSINVAHLRTNSSANVINFSNTASCNIGYGTGTTSCSSDARLKNLVGSAEGNLSKIMQLQPTYYTWKSEAANPNLRIGLVAQNVQTVLPEVVSVDDNGYLMLDYSALVSPLIGAVKEQQANINSLSNSLSVLQSTASIDKVTANFVNLNVSGQTVFGGLTVNGGAEFKGSLTVKGIAVQDDIAIGGIIISRGSIPTVEAGLALGAASAEADSDTSPMATVQGTDTAGTVIIKAGGQDVDRGVMAHVGFVKPHLDMTYRVVISASNEPAGKVRTYTVKTPTGFDIVAVDLVEPSVDYTFDYVVIGTQFVNTE